MLKIENFNKIRNQWYGDWQIGRTDEGNSYYALNAKHKDGKRSITVIIYKQDKLDTEFAETAYNISLMDDIRGSSSIIEDIIYKSVLEDSGQTNAIYANNALFNQTQLWSNDGGDSTSQYNLDYKINFNDNGHSAELEIDHNIYSGSSVANFLFPLGTTTDYVDFNKTNRKRTTINIDYANSISENSKIELGLQANIFKSLIKYESTGDSFNSTGVIVPTPNINFDYYNAISSKIFSNF